MQATSNICAECDESALRCPWKGKCRPRSDWKATPIIRTYYGKVSISYDITFCPGFIKPAKRRKPRFHIFTDDV